MRRRRAIVARRAPTLDELERTYREALAAESAAVNALPDRGASDKAIARCWELAEATNVAMRNLQIARETRS